MKQIKWEAVKVQNGRGKGISIPKTIENVLEKDLADSVPNCSYYLWNGNWYWRWW